MRYTIGEFARITRLSAKALRHYDELGLLRPARVDPWTGYRTYTADQAPRARAIALLRSLDLSLADVGEVLAASDEDTLRLLLDRHRRRLEDRMRENRQMLLQVERLIQRGAVMGLDITVKDVPATTLWTERVTATGGSEQIGAACGPAYHRIYAALAAAGVAPAGPAWLRYLSMDGDEWVLEVAAPVPADAPSPAGVTRVEQPPVRVAAAVVTGPYDELGLAYQEVSQWAGQQGYRAGDAPVFDIYLNDPAKVAPQEYLTEINLPLAPA